MSSPDSSELRFFWAELQFPLSAWLGTTRGGLRQEGHIGWALIGQVGGPVRILPPYRLAFMPRFTHTWHSSVISSIRFNIFTISFYLCLSVVVYGMVHPSRTPPLVHPPEVLHNVAHVLGRRPEAVTNFMLHGLIHVQEPLQQLAVQEPEWLFTLSLPVSKRPVGVEADIPQRLYLIRQPRLKGEQQLLGMGRNCPEHVDAAFDLHTQQLLGKVSSKPRTRHVPCPRKPSG